MNYTNRYLVQAERVESIVVDNAYGDTVEEAESDALSKLEASTGNCDWVIVYTRLLEDADGTL